jgi:hypothetical protein
VGAMVFFFSRPKLRGGGEGGERYYNNVASLQFGVRRLSGVTKRHLKGIRCKISANRFTRPDAFSQVVARRRFILSHSVFG